MGTGSNREKKKKKEDRTTGKRKTAKPPTESPPPRPVPRRLTIRGPAAPANLAPLPDERGPVDESDAVEALVSLGGRNKPSQSLEDSNPRFKAQMDRVFTAAIPGVLLEDLQETDDGKEHSESESDSSTDNSSESGSSSDSDNELDSSGMGVEPVYMPVADIDTQDLSARQHLRLQRAKIDSRSSLTSHSRARLASLRSTRLSALTAFLISLQIPWVHASRCSRALPTLRPMSPSLRSLFQSFSRMKSRGRS